jgi:NADPH:quinone reductase-like Zn-dependent oxidoreductase
MQAIVYPRYGAPDVLRLEDVEKPLPKDNQVLIKVYAASVNALDRHSLHAPPWMRLVTGNGLRAPKDPRIGADVAGRVEAIGSAVTRFQPGDAVFGIAAGSVGAFAEYTCAREDRLAPKPLTVSFETAAAVPVAALTALQGLRDAGRIQSGQSVLIQGASGGVGTFAVQIAKALGAEVTAVCSARNAPMVRAIGADQVIEYTKEDVTHGRRRYDLILAVNGYHSLPAYQRILGPRGRFVLVGEGSNRRLLRAMLQTMLFGRPMSRSGGQRFGFMGIANPNPEDLRLIASLLETGKVAPVIDKCYPLSETATAFRYLDEEHARGKVVITVVQDANAIA